jgi:flagellin
MPLNVISNFAANVAHRNLVASDMQATSSLAKLSAGTRVLTAKDDAASLAIGSRLAAEVSALRQATVNAGQGISLLQIADGSMARVNEILIRMKTLAVQAGSGQLSDIERGMLDTEFQALLAEIDRISLDTEFNGNQLLAGSQTMSATLDSYGTDDGVVSITLSDFTSGDTISAFDYTAATNSFLVTVEGVTYAGTIDADALSGTGATATMVNGTVVTLTSATTTAELQLTLNVSFDAGASSTSTSAVTVQGSSTTSFDFKIGSGTNVNQDVIAISVTSITVEQLGLTSQDLTSQSQADLASVALSAAIDTLQVARATVGASQNRLEFASANLATAVENTEAARSSLMDLDMASEMTNFTSKQILVQAGVSMLAQANQLPQNLLQLFQ